MATFSRLKKKTKLLSFPTMYFASLRYHYAQVAQKLELFGNAQTVETLIAEQHLVDTPTGPFKATEVKLREFVELINKHIGAKTEIIPREAQDLVRFTDDLTNITKMSTTVKLVEIKPQDFIAPPNWQLILVTAPRSDDEKIFQTT
jgi:hypothetical protein